MSIYNVSVTFEVRADNADEALKKVKDQVTKSSLIMDTSMGSLVTGGKEQECQYECEALEEL